MAMAVRCSMPAESMVAAQPDKTAVSARAAAAVAGWRRVLVVMESVFREWIGFEGDRSAAAEESRSGRPIHE
jgi:hypothetical protein